MQLQLQLKKNAHLIFFILLLVFSTHLLGQDSIFSQYPVIDSLQSKNISSQNKELPYADDLYSTFDPDLRNQQPHCFYINNQSLEAKPLILRLAIPSLLIGYGVMAQNSKALGDLDNSTNNEVKEKFTGSTSIDNFLQYVPAASVLGLNLAGVKGTHSLRDVGLVMATSYLIMGSSVFVMKTTTKRWRPDHSSQNSFPSGHTATAFVGAHILFKEYFRVSPWIAVGGYSVASVTGALRVINRRHWVSDVVAGAGMGILSVELSYLLLPTINNLFFPSKKMSNLSVAPIVNSESKGFGMVYVF